MNADKFFEKYSIEEISKKTKISPISLKFIKNKEFDKIPKAKFMGFISIIEKEFNVNLEQLKEEYISSFKEVSENIKIPVKKVSYYNYFYTIIAILFIIIGGYLLLKQSPKNTIQNNITIKEINNTKEINTNKINNLTIKNENNKSEINNTQLTITKNLENNSTNSIISSKNKKNYTKIVQEGNIVIIPHKKVWFKAINIDNNKKYEFLTSKVKILKKGNYYIKFGHGEITILYNDLNITPNTKKIVRILLKNNSYKYLTIRNPYEFNDKIRKDINTSKKNELNISKRKIQ